MPAVAEQRADDNSLDFDLGGLTFEPVTNSEPIAMAGPDADQDATALPDDVADLDFALDPLGDAITSPPADVTAAPAPASEEPFDLAFDMSFGEPQAAEVRDAAPAAVADHAAANHDIDMAGLAAEFDLPPLPAVAEDEVPALSAPAAAGKDPLFDLDTMDFGLPPTPVAPTAVAEATPFHEEVPAILGAPVPLAAAEDPLFDLDTMDFGSPAESTPAPTLSQPPVEPFEFDAPPAAAAAPAASIEEPLDFDMASDVKDPFALPDVPAVAQADAAAPAPATPSFDLTDIDLDLPSLDKPAELEAGLPVPGEALEPAAMSP